VGGFVGFEVPFEGLEEGAVFGRGVVGHCCDCTQCMRLSTKV
jgi:hypothetical protein